MLIFIWILVSIIVFTIIILVHEYGHFKTARTFWVKVEEFWLWIPPKAGKLFKDKHWTIYTLNWLPLWGFVRLKWENLNTFNVYDENKKIYNNSNLEKDIKAWKDVFDYNWIKVSESDKKEILEKLKDNYSKDSLLTKPSWQQAIIVLAWIFMNFLLASVIFSVLFFIWIWPIWINSQMKTNLDLKLIPTQEKALEYWILKENPWVYVLPIEWSIAKNSWLKDYDLVLKANWEELKNYKVFKEVIDKNKQTNINLLVKRAINCDIVKDTNCSFEEINISVIPSNDWKIWAYLVQNIEYNKDFKYDYNIIESTKYWFLETYNQVLFTFQWLKTLLQKIVSPKTPTERMQAVSQISGPIWVVDFMTKSITNWVIFIMIIWAIISINLWVFNLLPIPALDWWRFIFIVINWLIHKIFWRKAINENIEWIIHATFFIFLIAISVFIAYNDISKIVNDKNIEETK